MYMSLVVTTHKNIVDTQNRNEQINYYLKKNNNKKEDRKKRRKEKNELQNWK